MIKKIQIIHSGNIYLVKDNIVIKRLKIIHESGSFPIGRKVFKDNIKELPMTDAEKVEFL